MASVTTSTDMKIHMEWLVKRKSFDSFKNKEEDLESPTFDVLLGTEKVKFFMKLSPYLGCRGGKHVSICVGLTRRCGPRNTPCDLKIGVKPENAGHIKISGEKMQLKYSQLYPSYCDLNKNL